MEVGDGGIGGTSLQLAVGDVDSIPVPEGFVVQAPQTNDIFARGQDIPIHELAR